MRLPRIALALGLLALSLPLVGGAHAESASPRPIGHVWTIVLENSEFEETFLAGRSSAPYLTTTLPARGQLLTQYYGTGHSSLDNYLAMVSGQGPNPSTQDDCDDPTTLGGPKGWWHKDADGQAIDDSGADPIGCTYPTGVRTLAEQLDGVGVSWRAYMENMDAQPGKSPYCSNPFVTGPETPLRYEKEPNYKDKHNPWAYFHATFDRVDYCRDHVVPLGHFTAPQRMQGLLFDDLASIATTPQYSFLTPDQCHDGHDACPSNGNDQLAGADQFLRVVIPAIEASPAYKKDGLIIVTFDEGSTNLACCGEKKAPNLSATQNNGYPIPGPVGDGGGKVGAILISPQITPGTVDVVHQFNHYSYLRSMEDLFGVRTGGSDHHGHLGYAGQRGLVTLQQAGVIPAG